MRRTSRRNPRCPSCGGVSHPASGSVLPSGEVVCGPCVRRFWSWASEHGKKTYRVGPKGKGSKYIAFPTGITKKNARERGDCVKCSGTGYIQRFGHYAQGVCFDCGGTGNARTGGGRGPSLPPMTPASTEARIKSLVNELRTMWHNYQIHRREGEESLDEMFYSWSADEEEGKRQRGQDDSAPTEAKGKAYWIWTAQSCLDDLRKLGATEKADEIAKQFQTRLRIPVKNARRTSRNARYLHVSSPENARKIVKSGWLKSGVNRAESHARRGGTVYAATHDVSPERLKDWFVAYRGWLPLHGRPTVVDFETNVDPDEIAHSKNMKMQVAAWHKKRLKIHDPILRNKRRTSRRRTSRR
jgi:hypothetical protein